MLPSDDMYGFTKENVDRAPNEPGVYKLYEKGTLIYIGMSEMSIRSRLQAHYAGQEGRCTQAATEYQREPTKAAHARGVEAKLLQEYKRATGKLPKCNEAG